MLKNNRNNLLFYGKETVNTYLEDIQGCITMLKKQASKQNVAKHFMTKPVMTLLGPVLISKLNMQV